MNPMHHGITTTGASQFAVGVGEEARVEVGTLRGVNQNFAQAELSIARWIEEYNHDRPHRGLHGQTPHDARARFAQTLTSNTAPCV